MAPTAKIIQLAAESFSTIQRIVDLSRAALPPEAHQELQQQVKNGAKKARESLNGKAVRVHTLQEEESQSVIQLTSILDLIDNVAEEPEPPVAEVRDHEDG